MRQGYRKQDKIENEIDRDRRIEKTRRQETRNKKIENGK